MSAQKTKSKLTTRAFFITLMTGVLLGFLSSCYYEYREYRKDLHDLNTELDKIPAGYSSSLSESLWTANRRFIKIQLDSIAKLPDVSYVEIRHSQLGPDLKAGESVSENVLTRTFPINYIYNDRSIHLGSLYIEAQKEEALSRFIQHMPEILSHQLLIILAVALTTYFIIRFQVIQPLMELVDQVRSFDIRNPRPILHKSKKKYQNEIDELILTFNSLSQELIRSYNNLQLANKDLEQDIIERKLAEQKLLESEIRVRQLVEGTGDLITRVGPEGNFIFVNRVCEKIFGSAPEDLIGKKAFGFIHPDDRDATLRWFSDCTARSVSNCSIENRQINPKTGEISYLLWSSNFKYDEHGQLLEVDGIAHDITERKLREQEMETARKELEKRVQDRTKDLQQTYRQLLHAEKLSAIGKLSASFAHEFNNPLAGITNVIHGLKKRARVGHEDAQLIDMAIEECARLKQLIKNLQDFNRPTSGRKGPMDIHKTIDNLMLMVKNDLKIHGITVNKNYAAGIPQINAVADQIKQVLLNLITNATEACRKGDMISITTELLEKNLRIQIQDTGKGISPEDIDHIFEPFFTTKSEVSGTGLGLSISYGIIKRHGGSIKVKSDPEHGSTFTVTLPIEGATNDGEPNNPAG